MEKTVQQSNSPRLHAVIGSKGRPLLLVHAWPQTWYQWRLVMPALAHRISRKGNRAYVTMMTARPQTSVMALISLVVFNSITGMKEESTQ